MDPLSRGYRFPAAIISHAVWPSYQFVRSHRGVEELLAARVHPTPDTALCDGSQSLTVEHFSECVAGMRQVAAAVGRRVPGADPRVA